MLDAIVLLYSFAIWENESPPASPGPSLNKQFELDLATGIAKLAVPLTCSLTDKYCPPVMQLYEAEESLVRYESGVLVVLRVWPTGSDIKSRNTRTSHSNTRFIRKALVNNSVF